MLYRGMSLLFKRERHMPRPKTIEDCERVSVAISKKQLEWVRHTARKMPVQEGRTITTSEAIRMAVEAAYPVPKGEQGQLFD